MRVAAGLRPQPRIGFVGLGRMDLPMCANLVKAGYRVVASDARPECEGAAVECGALWSPRTAAVAGVAHVLITMLPGPREVEEAMAGAGDAVDALPAGAVGLDMTSNSPVVAGPIRERALGRGIDVLEAPAGGGVAAARARALQLFVGGDADVLQRPASNCEMNDSASRSGSAGRRRVAGRRFHESSTG